LFANNQWLIHLSTLLFWRIKLPGSCLERNRNCGPLQTRNAPVDAAIVVQRAREKYPEENPRIISDNGPQFIAKDFKELIRKLSMTHVKTSPYYPQSNGKKERFYGTLKQECIRPKTPLSLEEAKQYVQEFIDYYNTRRSCMRVSAILRHRTSSKGVKNRSMPPRDRKLARARASRKGNRQNFKDQASGETASQEVV
jgi:hypothetical protein